MLFGLATAGAAVMEVSVADKKGRVQTTKLSDGYTLLMIAKPAIEGIEDALKKAKVAGLRYEVTPLRKGASEIKLVLPDRITSFSVRRAKRKLKRAIALGLELKARGRPGGPRGEVPRRRRGPGAAPSPARYLGMRCSGREDIGRRISRMCGSGLCCP